jgi:hypothetical protein
MAASSQKLKKASCKKSWVSENYLTLLKNSLISLFVFVDYENVFIFTDSVKNLVHKIEKVKQGGYSKPQARRTCDIISFGSDMVTNQPTDGPTNGRTNIVSYRGATWRLKSENCETVIGVSTSICCHF